MTKSIVDALSRVGGRYAFSPWLLWFSGLFLIPGVLATEIPSSDAARWPLYLLSAVLAHLALVGGIFAGRWLLVPKNLSRSVPAGVVLTIYFFASQLRAVTFSVSLDGLSLSNQSPLWLRLLTSAALITTAYAFSSYSLESYRLYRDAREDLVRGIVEAHTELDRQKAVSESLRESLLGSVNQEIQEANQLTQQKLRELEGRLKAGLNVAPELQSLLDEADGAWRSISHSVWQAAKVSVPLLSTREFFGLLVRNNPLSRTAVSVGSIFLFALGLRGDLPLLPALLWTALWVVVMLLLTSAVNFLGRRVPRAGLGFLATSLVILAGSGALLVFIPGLEGLDAAGAIVLHVLVIATSVTVGYGPALIRNRQAILDALQADLDAATIERLRVESELVLIAQKVASRLHSTNRGLFLARVMTLQKALDLGDSEAALRALRALRESLDDVDPVTPLESPDHELLGFLNNWRGLVEIDSNLHAVQLPESFYPAVNTLVMDAVNDAVRHGGAEWIDIRVEADPERVILVVTNNGRPPAEGEGGMGSRTLDRLASGGWTRDVDEIGFTRVRAVVLVPQAAAAPSGRE